MKGNRYILYERLLTENINELFCKSNEMMKYLSANIHSLTPWQICDMVRKAPISLVRKQEMLEMLSNYEDKEELEQKIASALNNNEIYDAELIKEDSYFYQAEATKKAINVFNEKVTASEFSQNQWQEIEVFIEATEDEPAHEYTFYLLNGVLIYYDDYPSILDSGVPYDDDVNIPVPFAPGDIIICDGGTECGELAVLILRTGDNRDCCSLVGVCKREDGTLDCVPVKHTSMLYEKEDMICIPPLYTAKHISNNWEGEEKAAFQMMSNFISGDEDKGYILEYAMRDISLHEITEKWMADRQVHYEAWYKKHREDK